jgi:hypothetical protein
VIERSFAEGIQPRESAKMVRSIIGLTERQAMSVYQYRSSLLLDGHSQSEAGRRARRYSERLMHQRAITIARTETIGASMRGRLTAWRNAQQRGLLSNDVRKVWMTTPDDRLCRYCRHMNGQTSLLNSNFASLHFGPVDAPPLHPRCRCSMVLRVQQRQERAA